MADLWEEILAEAELADVAFPLHSRSFSGGRDWARIRPPYQPGQRGEDTGRKPQVFKLRIELFADIDESHYPQLFTDLLDVFTNDDERGEVEYTDPILGAFHVKVTEYDVDENADDRNGAVITCTLEEITDEQAITFLVPPRTPGRQVIEAAAELDEGLAEAGVTDAITAGALEASGFPPTGEEQDWPSGRTFESLASDFAEAVQLGVRTVDEVAAEVDRARARVRSVTTLAELRGVDGWRAYAVALRLIDALSAMGESALARAVPVVTFEVRAEMSAHEIALRLYGDAARAEEILRRNPSRRPFAYPVGTVLRVAQR